MQTFQIQKNLNGLQSSVPFFKKKFLKGYSKIHELKFVSIGLASPEKIQSWAEKELPNGKIFGEVTNANTFHYRTFQPTKGGLFCERIFGPLKDFECACGKRQKPTALESKNILEHKQTTRYFCTNCDVEYTWSIIRRYQLGYIRLNAPVTHLWYLKTNPSYLSLLFDMKRKDLEAIVYCTDSLTLENVWKSNELKVNYYGSVTDLYSMWQKLKTFKEKIQNYQNLFFKKKEEKIFHRLKFFSKLAKSDFSQTSQAKKNWKILNSQKNKETSLKPYKRKKNFSLFYSEKFQEGNFSQIQFQIFQSLQKEKKQNFFSFIFEKILKKNLKKIYLNNLLKGFSREFFFANLGKEKITIDLFQKVFFPNSFLAHSPLCPPSQSERMQSGRPPVAKQNPFGKQSERMQSGHLPSQSELMQSGKGEWAEKHVLEKKKKEKVFLSFFVFLNLSNSLFFELNNNKKPLKNRVIKKRNFLFLFMIVSLLKKEHRLQNFLFLPDLKWGDLKKQKKFYFSYQKLFHFFLLPCTSKESEISKKHNLNSVQNLNVQSIAENSIVTTNSIKNKQKYLETKFFHKKLSILFFSFFSENAQKIFLKKHKEEFFLDPIDKEKTKIVFQNKKKNYLTTFQFSSMKHDETLDFWSQIEKKNRSFLPIQKTKIHSLFISLGLEKSSVQISHNSVFLKKKRIFEKKEKKKQEFRKSGIFLESLQKDMKSVNFTMTEKKKEILFLSQKLQNFKKSFSFSGEQNKYFLSFSDIQNDLHKGNGEGLQVPLSKNLRNPIFTISYNFLWKNDSDWKYFVYYNSLFFSEFEDIPMQSEWYGEKKQQQTLTHLSSEKNLSTLLSNSEQILKHTQVGAGILEKLLIEFKPTELKKMIKQHQVLIPKINQLIHSSKQMLRTSKKDSVKIQKYVQKREHIIRRLKFLRKFYRKNSNPTFMILRNLPVLPPDLRPVLKLQNQIAASDLNRFYQRILYRNERLQKFSKDSATNQSFELRYAQRLLQEAVDNLIQNGKGGVKPETNSRGIPLKSLSEILKGKQGRFRQYLLGKRVDYSGRSVIVVGPKLKLYECGLPKEMAFELFLPFLIQQILLLNLAKTVVGAKNILKKDSILAFHLLKKVMKNIPVLLNRAPTLHRLGFQAFLPKLIEGRAILLHPMVCPGFNADFDGDQMAVHVPLTVEARTEAWKFMLSTNNFLNSATGDPVLLPTQDMVLGCYYLTTDFQSKSAAVDIFNYLRKEKNINFYNFQKQKNNFLFFSNFSDVFSAYQRKEISLHSPVWIRWNGMVDFGNELTKPVEIQVNRNGSWHQIQPKITTFLTKKNKIFSKFIRTTPGRIFMNLMIQEF